MKNATDLSDQVSYPASLLDWAGHRKGGGEETF